QSRHSAAAGNRDVCSGRGRAMSSSGAATDAGDVPAIMDRIGRAALEAAVVLSQATTQQKNAALAAAAAAVRANAADILKANAQDMQLAKARELSNAMLDRLKLDEKRLEGVALAIEEVIAQPDPIGQVAAEWRRPNGLHIQRVRVPLGVVGIIYESRPNVT